MTPNERDLRKAAEKAPTRNPWESLKISYVGDINKVMQSGGGKLSVAGGDPGEHRKQQPAE